MTIAKLSTKGQLVIPRDIRKRRGWNAGTELAIEDLGDAVVLRPIGQVKSTKLKDVLGCLRYRGKPKTLEEMDGVDLVPDVP